MFLRRVLVVLLRSSLFLDVGWRGHDIRCGVDLVCLLVRGVLVAQVDVSSHAQSEFFEMTMSRGIKRWSSVRIWSFMLRGHTFCCPRIFLGHPR